MSNVTMSSIVFNVTVPTSMCPPDSGPPINYSRGAAAAIGLVLFCFMVVTVIGNLVVISSFIIFHQLRTLTNYFVVSLAVADTLVALLVMPFGTYAQVTNLTWDLGQTFCLITTSLDIMLTTSSIFHLSFLAMDRYFAICNPFFYHERITKKTVGISLLVCWTVPILISWLPILAQWNTIGIEDMIACRTPPDGRVCNFLVNIPFAIVCSFVAFYVPTIFMICVNIRIYREARRQAMQIRSLEVAMAKPGGKNLKAETKAAKTLSIIMGTFILCWFPFFLCNIIDPFIGYNIPFYVFTVAIWLGYVNSTLNPFLYYFFNTSFKKAFNKVLSCRTCLLRGDGTETQITNLSDGSD